MKSFGYLRYRKSEMELIELGSRTDTDPKTIEVQADQEIADHSIYVFALTADSRKASDTRYINVE